MIYDQYKNIIEMLKSQDVESKELALLSMQSIVANDERNAFIITWFIMLCLRIAPIELSIIENLSPDLHKRIKVMRIKDFIKFTWFDIYGQMIRDFNNPLYNFTKQEIKDAVTIYFEVYTEFLNATLIFKDYPEINVEFKINES